MASRMLGTGSGLHVNVRQPDHVRPAEAAKLKEEMEEVDKDVWLILDSVQEEAVFKALEQGDQLVTIRGPWGSGKTLVGIEILRRQVEKVRKATAEEPIVIVTSTYPMEDSPLGKQLLSSAERMGGKFVPWLELLKEKGVERVRLEECEGYDLAEEITSLGEKLHEEARGKPTLLLIDEVFHYWAPLSDEARFLMETNIADISHQAPVDTEKAGWNWFALEKIPQDVRMVIIFNPGFVRYPLNLGDRILLLPSSCLRLCLSTTYRSTRSIINLQRFLHSYFDERLTPAPSGTEVVGELPRLVVMGNIGHLNLKEAAARIKWVLDLVSSFVAREEQSGVTVIDEGLSFSNLLAKEAGDRG